MQLRHRWLALSFVLVCGLVATAAAWQPVEGPLKTRWTKDVRPDKVLPEYPRPQMVREEWTNLNGLWNYAIRPTSEGKPAKWDGEILVPFAVESALSGVKKPVQPDEKLWYRRTFSGQPLPGRKRLLLHFGAVDWKCTIWVNDKQVGEHTGGYDPFTFDITDALHDGDNELVVAVTDPTDSGFQPHGKQWIKPHGIWYTAVTGIWQTVWLEPVPQKHIASLKIVPDVDRQLVTVTVQANDGFALVKAFEPTRDGKYGIAAAKTGRPGEPIELQFQNAQLWSPDDPKLYELEINLLGGAKSLDSVRSYFGMRKIEVKKDVEGLNRLWLNNKVLFQYGPLDQGWWPDGLYTAPTDEALKYDIEMTKRFGMNMARKHVKVEPDRWYYWCDKLGLLVWQDMPSGETGRNEEAKENFRRELQAMIDARRNHPSIVMWVPFNEGWGQHDTPEIVSWLKKYDPSRPVNEASGWNDQHSGDVSDMHSYPGPGMREPEEDRVGVLGEFGGLGMPLRGHTWQQEKNWGYVSYDNAEKLTDAYINLLTAMRPLIGRGLSAAVYTQTTDVEIEVNGLMSYDRAVVKMDANRIKAAAQKLYLPPPKIEVIVPTSEQSPQTWRYTITKPADDWFDMSFDDIKWQSGPAGFGMEKTPGAIVRTKWNSPDIWMRRTFELKSAPKDGRLALKIHHDDDAEVYLNGKPIKSFKRHTNNYQVALLDNDAKRLLRIGENTLAVHCRQTGGGQYIDAGLVEIVESKAPQ